jgi:hypothetical protein
MTLSKEQLKIMRTALEHLKVEYEAVGDPEDDRTIKVINQTLGEIKSELWNQA